MIETIRLIAAGLTTVCFLVATFIKVRDDMDNFHRRPWPTVAIDTL